MYYKFATSFQNGGAYVEIEHKTEEKTHYTTKHIIDSNGKITSDLDEYEVPTKCYEMNISEHNQFCFIDEKQQFIVRKNHNGKKYEGILNTDGKVVIPCFYDQINQFYGLYELGYEVKLHSKSGVIDYDGKILLPCVFDEIIYDKIAYGKMLGALWSWTPDKGFIRVFNCEKYEQQKKAEFLKERKEDILIKNKWNNKYRVEKVFLQEHFYLIDEENELYGVVDGNGEILIPIKYERLFSFDDSFFMNDHVKDIYFARKDNQYGVIDINGKIILPFEYDYLGFWSEKICTYKKDRRYGLMNIDFQIITAPIYDDAYVLKEGLAPVKKDGRWGYINNRGEVIIPFKYEEANCFNDGLALVYEHNLCIAGYKYIDKNDNTAF